MICPSPYLSRFLRLLSSGAKAVNDREGFLLRAARALHDSIELRMDDRLKCANHLADHARASIAAAKDLLSPPFAILWV
jgi:hypothetical protein